MINRQPSKPGRIKLIDEEGNEAYYIMERADEPTEEGTPLNKYTLFNGANEERYSCSLPSEAFTLLTKEWQVNVPASGWSSEINDAGYYTQNIPIEEMKSVFQPNFAPLYTTASSVDLIDEVFTAIKRMITSDGSVTFLATEIPENDIVIRIWRI